MTRILRVINRLNVGGPTYNVAYLSKYLPSEYDTKIISGMIDPGEASSSYVLDELGLSYTYVETMFRRISLVNDIRSLIRLIKVINEFKPDIIHTHAAKAGAIGRTAAILAKHKVKAIVHTYHGNIFDGYFSKFKSSIFILIEKTLAYYTHAIVSISNRQKDELVQKYKIAKEEKIYVIPLGFDLDKFAQTSRFSGEAIRKEFNISPVKTLVVITGRLAPIKNHNFLLEVISVCRTKYDLDFTTMIVGDGEMKDALKNHCRQLNLSYNHEDTLDGNEQIIFSSWRKDIPQINAAADVCVLCSLNEGTPVSIIEAMASGKPVITSRVGGVEDFIVDGENGLISDLNIDEFAQKLKKIIGDQSFSSAIAQKAKISVLQKFDYKRLITDMHNLYFHLLNNHK